MVGDDVSPTMWGKRFSTNTTWLPEGGCQLLKDDWSYRPFHCSNGLALRKKGDRVAPEKSIDAGGIPISKKYTADEMEAFLVEIEKAIMVCNMFFSLTQLDWWSAFFSRQRYLNGVFLLDVRPLLDEFCWPERNAGVVPQPSHVDVVDKEEQIARDA